MSENERLDLARALLASLRSQREATASEAPLGPEDHEAVAIEVVSRLMTAQDALRATFRKQLDNGEFAASAATKAQIDEISVLTIGLNRAIITLLDEADDVAAATQELRDVTKSLVAAAKRTKAEAAALADVASAVDLLTDIVDF